MFFFFLKWIIICVNLMTNEIQRSKLNGGMAMFVKVIVIVNEKEL